MFFKLRSVSQWARILQTTFPHSLDGWLSCLFDQWEVLHCKAGLEMEKGDKEGEVITLSFLLLVLSLAEMGVYVLH